MSHDLSLAFRAFRRQPLFSSLVVTILALGIGATTAIFSIVDGVLLRPLPFADPDRLVELWESNPDMGWDKNSAAPANMLDWQEQNKTFLGIAGYAGGAGEFILSDGKEPVVVRGQPVTAEFFDVLGVSPILGRTFKPDENWSGEETKVLLSHGFWRRQFGGDPGIVGKAIRLNSENATVLGVMPADFGFPTGDLDFWTTFAWDRSDREMEWFRRAHMLQVLGRLKPGVSLDAAAADLRVIAARLESQYPATNQKMGAGLTSLDEWLIGSTRRPLLVLLGAIFLVLVLACANVANLILVRSSAQAKETAIRNALGAGRMVLIRQRLSESVVLALVAGGLGLLLAYWGQRALVAVAPENIPRLESLSIDGRVLAFALLLTLFTVAVSSLIPAILASRPEIGRALRDASGRGLTAGVAGNRVRWLLVIGEVALAFLLVAGASLLTESFRRLNRVDPGFRSQGLLRAQISLPSASYPKSDSWRPFYARLLEDVGSRPGVVSAAVASRLPAIGGEWTSEFSVEGRAGEDHGVEARHLEVSPGYFQTLAIPVVAGRSFTAADDAAAPRVVLINQTLARRFTDRPPLGRRIAFEAEPTSESDWYTIIGVVKDTKQYGLDAEITPEVYKSATQVPKRAMNLMVRTTGDPLSQVAAVRSALRSIDPDLAPIKVMTMDEAIGKTIARPRFVMILFLIFGMLAFLLAEAGTFAVMAYTTDQRKAEFGIRLAMGAKPTQITGSVLKRSFALIAIGLGIGGVAYYFGLNRFLSTLLFEVTARDSKTLVLVALLLGAGGLFAAYLPARQAARTDPNATLRSG